MIIELQKMLSPQRIAERITKLCTDLNHVLRQQPGLTPLGPGPTTDNGIGLVSTGSKQKTVWRSPSGSRQTIDVIVKPLPPTYELDPSAEHPSVDYHALRFSTHVYNDEQDRGAGRRRAVSGFEQIGFFPGPTTMSNTNHGVFCCLSW